MTDGGATGRPSCRQQTNWRTVKYKINAEEKKLLCQSQVWKKKKKLQFPEAGGWLRAETTTYRYRDVFSVQAVQKCRVICQRNARMAWEVTDVQRRGGKKSARQTSSRYSSWRGVCTSKCLFFVFLGNIVWCRTWNCCNFVRNDVISSLQLVFSWISCLQPAAVDKVDAAMSRTSFDLKFPRLSSLLSLHSSLFLCSPFCLPFLISFAF